MEGRTNHRELIIDISGNANINIKKAQGIRHCKH